MGAADPVEQRLDRLRVVGVCELARSPAAHHPAVLGEVVRTVNRVIRVHRCFRVLRVQAQHWGRDHSAPPLSLRYLVLVSPCDGRLDLTHYNRLRRASVDGSYPVVQVNFLTLCRICSVVGPSKGRKLAQSVVNSMSTDSFELSEGQGPAPKVSESYAVRYNELH